MRTEEELNRLAVGGAHFRSPAFVCQRHTHGALWKPVITASQMIALCNNPLNSWTLAPVDSADIN